MRSRLGSVGAIAALALLAAAVMLGQAGQRGAEVSALPSAANVGPRGAAAAAELLRSAGAMVTIRRSGEPAVADAGVVLVVAPSSAVPEDEVAALRAAAAGGTTVLIALGSAPQPALLGALGLSLSPGEAPRVARGLAPHRIVGDLELPGRSAALSPTRHGDLPVSGDERWASAVSVAAGAGELLVLSGPEPLENAHLLEGDAVSLVVRLAALGPVVFDERFLEPSQAAAPPSRRALALLTGQLLLVGLGLIVARGRRLGAIRPPAPPGSERTARDYLVSLAELYRRAGAEEELARRAWQRLRRRLERRWAVPARLSDAEAARRLARRSAAAAVALAQGSSALSGGGRGVLLRVTRAAADAERGLVRRGGRS